MKTTYANILLAVTPLAAALAYAPGGRWLLPLVATLLGYPAFAAAVRERRLGRAWCLGMVWATLLSAGVILVTQTGGATAGAGILNGEPYRAEMFGWIATGEARETSFRAFFPEHMLHLGLFVVLAAVSGGFLGLLLGAALTAYMSYFVGSYAVAADLPLLGSIVAWVPWSVIRVGAFVLLGSVLSRPLLTGGPWRLEKAELRLVGIGLLGILGDLTLKTFLAPSYGLWLRSLAGGAFG